jgi:trans-2,3-dihydro-3-hydroxyanthranilate isomerase
VFGLGVGPVPVSLTWKYKELSFAWMTQPNPTFSEPIANLAGAAAAVGLSEAAVAGTGLPVQVVSSGVPFLFVPLVTRRAVDSAAIDRGAFDQLLGSANAGAQGVFLFSRERGADKADIYSRMFAPALGVAEDAATGSASGPLGCYLVRHKVVPPEKAGAIVSLQGVKMGRPSYVHISIDIDRGEISSVRVGGESVLAGEGTLYV